MQRIKLSISLAFMLMLVLTCQKFESLIKEPVYIQLSEKSKNLVASSNNFGFELFQKLVANSETPTENIMISPLSISLALSMTFNGASGLTRTDIQNTLGFGGLTDDEININNKQIVNALLNLDNNVDFSIANSIWYRNTFSVLPDFISVNRDFYNAEVNSLNFEDPDAKDIINNWVADNTNNKIKEVVNQVDADVIMYLINAIYFNGIWKYEFIPSKNFYRNFTFSDGDSKQAEMMVQSTNLKYLNSGGMQIVELPYGQGNWTMDLVLPEEGKNIDQMISEMSGSIWDSLMMNLSNPVNVTISLPPFKFEYESDMNNVLMNMGMEVAFSEDADFSMISKDAKLYISKVKHKTFIELNEQGTEAAAVTSVEISETSSGNGNERIVIFDRPFLFVIREISTGVILFIGKVENPNR
jgi:serpin B